MPTAADPGPQLHSRLHDIASTLPDGWLGVSVFDYLSGCAWHYDSGRWFHAASTIKIAILAAVFDAIDAGRFTMESRVHVRNYFRGALDGLPFRVQANRDANADVYQAIGRTMRIGELARHMIASSSKLATNLLLEVTGLEAATAALSTRGVTGVDLQRGVEDDRAHQAGCNNRVTADGLVRLLRVIRSGAGFTEEPGSRGRAHGGAHRRVTGGLGRHPGRGRGDIVRRGSVAAVRHDSNRRADLQSKGFSASSAIA